MVSLLFGEVELMETPSAYKVAASSLFFESLLFGEVELMETCTRGGSSRRASRSRFSSEKWN